MKILAIADRPPAKPLIETVEREHPALILMLGDLEIRDLNGLEAITNIPKIGVYGNHCSGTYFPMYGIENMHLATKDIGGIVFGGFEGSVRYKAGNAPMYTQEEATHMLADFPYVDVMLAHSPPRGVHDEDDPAHQGFDALHDYILRMQPKYLLHGHTYISGGIKEDIFGSTKVVHIYADRILDLDT